nr:MAG TPA: hypothetical protein [Caudoviricetes sp.]
MELERFELSSCINTSNNFTCLVFYRCYIIFIFSNMKISFLKKG